MSRRTRRIAPSRLFAEGMAGGSHPGTPEINLDAPSVIAFQCRLCLLELRVLVVIASAAAWASGASS